MADATDQILQQILQELQKQRTSPSSGPSNQPTTTNSSSSTMANLESGFKNLAGSASGLTGAMISGTSGLSGMTSAALGAAGSFESLTEKIPGLNTLLGGLGGSIQGSIQYLEANISAYRSLSKVGLSLGGDVGKLGQLAGNANMALGPFAELIAQNKDLLLGFSDGLDGGTKNLSAMLKEFSEGSKNFQRDFMALGFTLEESNELFARNLLIQRRTNLLTGKSQADAAKAATDLATQMSTLSKLTGEDVKSIQDKILQEQMAGDNALMIREMEAQGFKEAGNAHAEITAQLGMLGPEYVQMFKEYAQYGTLMSDQSKDFANQNREAADMIFGSAMAFRGHNADEAKAMTKEATALTLEYQRSVEFMQMGQKAMLGGPYEAAKKSFENTQQIQRRIDAVLAEDPSMTVSQAIAKIMEDARTATQSQIDEGQRDGALGTVNAIEQEAAKALGVLNETASSIISDSQNLFATVKDLATTAISTLTEGAKFAFETVSETNRELVNDLRGMQGQTLNTGAGQVQITEELINKLDKFVDPTTGNKEKESLQKELQTLGLVNEKGDINTDKQSLSGSMDDVIRQLESKNAFGDDTGKIIDALKADKQNTVAGIEENFNVIYKMYEKFFTQQAIEEEKWAKAEQKAKKQIYDESPKTIYNLDPEKQGPPEIISNLEPEKQAHPVTNTPTSKSDIQKEKEATGNEKDDVSNLSMKISESMVNAEVDGMIQLTIPADQISLSSIASPKGNETAQLVQSDVKQYLGPVSETFMRQEKLLGTISSNTNKIGPSEVNSNKGYDQPNNKTREQLEFDNSEVINELKMANVALAELKGILHSDNATVIGRLDSLVGINTTANNLSDRNLRYMKEIVA